MKKFSKLLLALGGGIAVGWVVRDSTRSDKHLAPGEYTGHHTTFLGLPPVFLNPPITKDTPAMPIPFTMTNESITVILTGKSHTVQAGTPQYHSLRRAIFDEQWESIEKLVTLSGSLQQWLGDKFVVDGRAISYDGVPLADSLSRRIFAMAAAGESPEPLFKFYERLHKNPSFQSRTQLYDFLTHVGVPIEPDGTFLAYKGVKHDYTDGHSGTVDNSPGRVNKMARNLISDNPAVACHVGFHVGALQYAHNFSDRVVICRVDPEHVVCVPNDHSFQKMRVCEYLVVGNWTGAGDSEFMPSTTVEVDVDTSDDPDWGGDVEGEDQDEYDNAPSVDYDALADGATPEPAKAKTVEPKPARIVAGKPAAPKAAKFARMSPATLMEQPIEDLRKYASAHLKIVGASKMPGGKATLISKILKVRRRRRS